MLDLSMIPWFQHWMIRVRQDLTLVPGDDADGVDFDEVSSPDPLTRR